MTLGGQLAKHPPGSSYAKVWSNSELTNAEQINNFLMDREFINAQKSRGPWDGRNGKGRQKMRSICMIAWALMSSGRGREVRRRRGWFSTPLATPCRCEEGVSTHVKWLFSSAWDAVRLTLKVRFICSHVVLDPTDVGATTELLFQYANPSNLSQTQNTCPFTDGTSLSEVTVCCLH